jgi:hypothetical protein
MEEMVSAEFIKQVEQNNNMRTSGFDMFSVIYRVFIYKTDLIHTCTSAYVVNEIKLTAIYAFNYFNHSSQFNFALQERNLIQLSLNLQ